MSKDSTWPAKVSVTRASIRDPTSRFLRPFGSKVMPARISAAVSDRYIRRVAPIDPVDHRLTRSRPGQFGHDVGVQDDHAPRSTARAGSVLLGMSNSTPPISAN
jgi:hypothetical protein